MEKFDFLVIGGGVAGLSYALEVAKFGSVAVLFKKNPDESSTAWAQGGIAAVTAEDDNIELHLHDTIKAGAGLCKEEIVRLVVSEGPKRVWELIGRGAQFDKDSNGDAYHLHREAGHSRRRIFHSGDTTGYEIQNTLLESAKREKNIQFFVGASAIDLITSAKLRLKKTTNQALGAYALHEGKIKAFVASKILVATGGAGKIYLYTSNPDVATGDGIAMCYRAGARVANMEFFQFHPTCLYHPLAKSFLITEALRGEGGKLRRANGELFMHKYHKDAELAPRDVVARAIDQELKRWGDDCVYLDVTHLKADFLKEHFPKIFETCLSFGIDISRQPIPVVPAAHYLCGGVVSNEWGESDIQNLYVAGECAHTGLHGANRLASNSLLEGLVFGYRAAKKSLESFAPDNKLPTVPDWDSGSARDNDEEVVISHNWDEIRRFMWNYVGIVRSNKRLERAMNRCNNILQEIQEYYWNFILTPDLIELRNLSLVANLVIRSAQMRHESRGLHFNLDYPNTRPEAAQDTIIAPGH